MRFDYITLILFLSSLNQSNAFVTYLYCKFKECCQKPWISNDIEKFALSLKKDLFGQYIVQESVPKLIETHINNLSPNKPLVLSFHGWPGTGKTLVSKLIAQSLFSEGINSKFVKYIAVPLFRDKLHTNELIEELRQIIKSSLIQCEQTLFIFEDIHALNPMVLDGLLPYIYNPSLRNGVNYRKAIYVLICNSAATRINEYLTEKFNFGIERRLIRHEEMQKVISDKIFIEEGAFKNSEFVSKGIIDAYIPFLPLERNHVKKCIQRAILARGFKPTLSMVIRVLNEIVWVSNGIEMFASSGCKRIEQIITLHYMDL